MSSDFERHTDYATWEAVVLQVDVEAELLLLDLDEFLLFLLLLLPLLLFRRIWQFFVGLGWQHDNRALLG